MGHQYRYPIPYGQYSYFQQQQQQHYQSQRPSAPSQQATNICQLCNSQGHYDYQCQFAGDFMARTQKACNLKAAADTELFDLEKRAIQIDIEKYEYNNSSEHTDDNSSPSADDDIASQRAEDYYDDMLQTEVSHVQLPTVGEKYHVNHDDNTL